MAHSKAAQRYAKAIFDIATEKGALEVVKSDFEALNTAANESIEFQSFLQAPLLKSETRIEILKALFAEKLNALTFEYLLFLESQKRTEILGELAAAFLSRYEELNNIQNITVTSAFAMETTQLDSIKAKLNAKLNKEIVAEVNVDPELIGGFRVQVGDQVKDLTVKTQLAVLQASIVNA